MSWRSRLVVAAWALLCSGLYSAVALARFVRIEPTSYDNAIFEEAVRGYAHFGPPIVNIKGPGFNLLGDHFSPVLALLGPLYRVFPSAPTLLIAQAVLVGASVYVVAALAVRHGGWFVGGALGGANGLSFGAVSAVDSGFHEVAFATPLLALAGAAFVERRWRATVAWSLPLFAVKEDLGVTIAAIGVALWLVGERRRGAWLAVGGCVGVALIVLVLIPWAGNSEYGYGLGNGLLSQPETKALTVLMTLGVGGVVALLSPWALVAVPTLAWRFLADNPYYWGTDFHYSLVLMPIMTVAAVDALRRHRRLAVPGALLAVCFTATSLAGSPLLRLAHTDLWHPTVRQLAGQTVLDRIPQGVRVDSDIGLMTQLVTNRDVTWIGTPGNVAPDWVVLDHGHAFGSPNDAASYATTRYGHRYRTVMRVGTFDVARSVSSAESSPQRRAPHRVAPQ